jgi:hypothetical protein
MKLDKKMLETMKSIKRENLIREITPEMLKAEIEKCMEQGMTYEEACAEWDVSDEENTI